MALRLTLNDKVSPRLMKLFGRGAKRFVIILSEPVIQRTNGVGLNPIWGRSTTNCRLNILISCILILRQSILSMIKIRILYYGKTATGHEFTILLSVTDE
jgi:hypothetical protein